RQRPRPQPLLRLYKLQKRSAKPNGGVQRPARPVGLRPLVREPARRAAATGGRLGPGAAALNSARPDSYEGSPLRSSGRAAVTVAALTTALGVMRDRGGTPQRQARPAPSAAIASAPVQATKAIRQGRTHSSAAGGL